MVKLHDIVIKIIDFRKIKMTAFGSNRTGGKGQTAVMPAVACDVKDTLEWH